ncbi:MAG: family 43 glycosylhydrolase [Reichenbachiella sp.]
MKAKLEENKPQDGSLSPAMERLYDVWPAPDDQANEFFTNFKYSKISGIGNDGEASRRDPTKVIKANGKYYVWYTKRAPGQMPVGMDNCTDELPAVDWDLADICFATSDDGFEWEEKGVAVPRSEKGSYGDRSLTTPDILVFKGRYYLYYQTFTGKFSSKKGDYCDVSMAWSDSPDGPWHKTSDPILPLGQEDEWDGGAIHDPYPLVYKGKIWLFYKGQPITRGPGYLVRAQGVAIAEKPEGPFVKHELNPLLNSGHETCLYPYREGIAAVLSFDGPEKNTIQYASDGVDFKPMAAINCPPIAPGPYCPDAFDDDGDGKGITWGLCHLGHNIVVPTNERRMVENNSFIVRFDCDLHRDTDRPYFKNPRDQVGRFDEATYFQPKMMLEQEMKAEIIKEDSEV